MEKILKYIAENRLEITETHGTEEKFVWTGEITMHTLKHGIIVWRYIQPTRIEHFIGYKQCVIEEEFNTIILIGDENKGYGKEVLKRI